jgi:hypothetical protein
MNPYCPRLTMKWLQADANELVGWIQFSDSWRKNSLHYRSHVRKFKMEVRPYLGFLRATAMIPCRACLRDFHCIHHLVDESQRYA